MTRLANLRDRLRARVLACTSRNVSAGHRARLGRHCRVLVEPGARLILGDGCVVDDGTTIAVYGSGSLVLGAGSFVGHHSTIAAHAYVEIGDGAFLAELVSVRDHDHRVGLPPSAGAYDVAPVVVGADVWIGAKATLLRGARIGNGSVVGAHALVRGEIPPGVVAVGIPARVVKDVERVS